MILSINCPHLKQEKIETRSDHLAIQCIQHLVTPSTYLQFQIFVQLKSQEMEITGCVDGCNFLSSQEQAGGEYMITSTLYLPKGCSMLDLACLEANSINDLVATQTQQTKQSNGANKDNRQEPIQKEQQ